MAFVDGGWRDAIPDRQRGYHGNRYRGAHKCRALNKRQRLALERAVGQARRGPSKGYGRISVKNADGRWVIVDVRDGTIDTSVQPTT